MIIPHRDYKLSQYRKTGLEKKIFVLSRSSAKNSLLDINTHLVTYKILLSTCVDKEYVLGFDMREEMLGRFKKDYDLYAATVTDVLDYCQNNNNSLMIMSDKPNIWTKMNTDDDDVSVFYMQLREDS